MSAEHDSSRRALARVAGLILMGWGILFAMVSAVIALGVVGYVWFAPLGGHSVLLGAAVAVGGLIAVAIGAGKAMAGWILVKKDQSLD